MLIGFFEGIESERGIAWRVADSLCLRQFLQIGLDERTPDHVTISHKVGVLEDYGQLVTWALRLGIRTRQNWGPCPSVTCIRVTGPVCSECRV
jgi:hypothetical protein